MNIRFKILVLLGSVLFFSNCEKTKDKNKHQNYNKEIARNTFENLFSKFKSVDIDTMKVYASDDFGSFKGVKIDSLDVVLFPKEIQEAYFLEREMYACYKFNIDSDNLGLILRTPSEYVTSSIKLFVYNKKKNKILDYLELAENTGDAGASLEISSWIINDGKGKIQILKRSIESYDHSADDENDTIVETWSSHCLIGFSSVTLDTISKDSTFLVKKYKRLLE